MLLLVGLFMIPIWAGIFALQLWDIPFDTDLETVPIWIALLPLIIAVGGAIAAPSLFRAISSISDGRNYLQAHKRTRTYLIVGLCSMLLGSPFLLAMGPRGLVFLGLLPLIGSWHIFRLLRRGGLI